MSLEVNGRHGGVPVSCQREGEGFRYVDGDNPHGTHKMHTISTQ